MSEEHINTIVVLDLETNGLPSEQFNTCSITELSIYAFSAKCLTDNDIEYRNVKDDIEGVKKFEQQPLELPRVLHKLTLMINPRRLICPTVERITGLSNELLERESPFDRKTAECLHHFLERLEKPICMVAHNGWLFDYPIIRHVHEKINMSFPSSIYCIDSLKAFRELDEKRQEIEKIKTNFILDNNDNGVDLQELDNEKKHTVDEQQAKDSIISNPLEQSSLINWQRDNETTPHRKSNAIKRSFSAQSNNEGLSGHKRSISLAVRRSLFSDEFTPKRKYPERGVYKLGNIYERVFKQAPENLHRAEADVEILTKLILYYGLDFLAYAEERKESFAMVPKLGSISN